MSLGVSTGFLVGVSLGKTLKSHTGETVEKHKDLICRRDITEIILKAV